ncbi:signal-regulatory protein beta-1 isoform X4 [Calypte anna]|uniref:signal-regulatory protein beta-1 isoform X4 n=1 Tax=Calypte anna TaxID=9244 RepID=UPI0011C36351|nr:signal-regulatory protein beta-1 isoform X4 [Calypte anna]
MAWRAAAAAQLLLGQLSLFALRLSGVGAQVSEGFQLQQPQDKVSVTAGETLTLTCTTSGYGPPGPLKWLKGWGMGNETVYDQNSVFPRVTRAEPGSNTDFSIYLRDVGPEDAGTYYCVKFRKRFGVDEMFQHGKGTEVSLHAKSLMQRPHICPASSTGRMNTRSTTPTSSPCPQPHGTAGPFPPHPALSTPVCGWLPSDMWHCHLRSSFRRGSRDVSAGHKKEEVDLPAWHSPA